jgi:hypothetical protein
VFPCSTHRRVGQRLLRRPEPCCSRVPAQRTIDGPCFSHDPGLLCCHVWSAGSNKGLPGRVLCCCCPARLSVLQVLCGTAQHGTAWHNSRQMQMDSVAMVQLLYTGTRTRRVAASWVVQLESGIQAGMRAKQAGTQPGRCHGCVYHCWSALLLSHLVVVEVCDPVEVAPSVAREHAASKPQQQQR